MQQNALDHIKKLNDSGELGFFQDGEIYHQIPLLMNAGFIRGQRLVHDKGVIYSKVEITAKGLEYLESQKLRSEKKAITGVTDVLKRCNDKGVTSAMSVLIGFVGILVTIVIYLLGL
ncbi:hypothetical protein [uncultured Shewanella sp.]|uniref:hypothetical protein n=1 Tax=uncultured Shewanella sp. TaxID=173975 RepID=UPI00262E6F67|nr:hypothetical protein [uncultured Shewanella sp.]